MYSILNVFKFSHHRLTLLACSLSTTFLLSCSLLLDPENCETNADCEGGVCQDGVCIGAKTNTNAKDQNLSDAFDVFLADQMIEDQSLDVDQTQMPKNDMIMPIDQMIEDMAWLFSCDFDVDTNQNDINQWILLQDQLYTKQKTIRIPLKIALPDHLNLAEHVKLKSSKSELTLAIVQENDNTFAELTFEDNAYGEFLVSLEISKQQIYCTQNITIIRDISNPQIRLISPNNPNGIYGLGLDPEGTATRNLDVLIDADDQILMTLYVNGQKTDLPMLQAFSRQSFNLGLNLQPGDNYFKIEVEDLLGQRSNAIDLQYTYDQVNPTLMLDPVSNQVVSPTFTITGVVFDAMNTMQTPEVLNRANVSIFRQDANQRPIGNPVVAQTDQNGRFSTSIELGLGFNYVKVCVEDVAENQKCQLLQNIQYQPPAPCITVESSNYFTALSQNVTGTVCASVTSINAYLDDRSLGVFLPSSVGSNGLKTFSIPITLSAFATTSRLRLEAFTNTINQAPASQNLSLIADQTSPIILITQPTTELCTSSSEVELCASVTENESGLEETRVNQRLVNVVDGSFCERISLSNGSQNLVVSATNRSGLSQSAQISIQRDNLAPQITFDLPEQSWYPISNGTTEISGTVSVQGCPLSVQGLRIKTRQSNGSFGPVSNPALLGQGRFNYPTGISNSGDQSLQAEIADTAGNVRLVDYAFKADGIPPQIDLLEPSLDDTYTQSATATIRLSAFDLHSGIQRILINQQQINFNLVGGRAEINQQIALNAGVNQIQIKAIDAVGIEQIRNITIERDLSPPTVRIISPTITDQAHTKEIVILDVQDSASGVDQVTVNGVVATQDGAFWVADSVVIAETNSKISVVARDFVGNQTAPIEQSVALLPYAKWTPTHSGLGSGLYEQAFWFNPAGQNGLAVMTMVKEGNLTQPALFKRKLNGQNLGFQTFSNLNLPTVSALNHKNGILTGTVQNQLSLLVGGIDQTTDLSSWLVWRLNAQNQFVSTQVNLDETRIVESQSWIDLNGDALLDLIAVISNPDQTFISGNRTAIFGFTQNLDGTFNLETLDDFGITPITQHEHLCVLDANNDAYVDLIVGDSTGSTLWKKTGINTFEKDLSFNSHPIEDCLQMDWNQNGKLDLISRFGSVVYRDEFDGGAWTQEQLFNLNQNIRGWLVTDFDLDLNQELLFYGDQGLTAKSNGGNFSLLPLGISVNQTVYSADLGDFDLDGDDDLLVASNQGLILFLPNRNLIESNVNPITMRIKRGDGLSSDAYFSQIYIDADRNNIFEKVISAKPNAPTVLNLNASSGLQVNLKIVFPEQGIVGGFQRSIPNRNLGTSVDVIDPQQ